MGLTNRGKLVLGLWSLFVGLMVVDHFSMTRVTLRYVGRPPSGLSDEGVVDQTYRPERFIPFWSYKMHLMESNAPIVFEAWVPVRLGKSGGDIRLPTHRALSLGAYSVNGNELYVGFPGAEEEVSKGREVLASGWGLESPGTGGRTNIRYHFFNVGRLPNAYAIELPLHAGGEVTLDFSPVLETQVVEPRVPPSQAGDFCDSQLPSLKLHLHEVKSIRYDPIYRSPAEGRLPLPSDAPATEVWFNDQDRPYSWIHRSTLSAVRSHAIQPEGYRVRHDAAHHEVHIERDQETVHQVAHHSWDASEKLRLMLVTTNPVGDYSGIECFAVEPIE